MHNAGLGGAAGYRLLLALLMLLLPAIALAQPRGLPKGPLLMGYHDSWRERPATGPYATALVAVPSYVNLVALSFARPDMVYDGGLDISGTGLSYQFDGAVLRDAIALLKKRNPGTRVILSLGPPVPSRWSRLNERAVARLVRDLGLDGVDLDYEPDMPGCGQRPDGRVRCATDANWIDYVRRVRAVLPRPYIVSVTGWSVGAYGEGRFADGLPRNSPWRGMMIGLLRSPAARLIDLVVVCGYDAGPTYSPMHAIHAYRAYWKGPLVMGVQVPFTNAGGPLFTPPEVERLARQAVRVPATGMMIYSLLEPPDPLVPARSHPTGKELARAACRGLGRTPCAPYP
jgi:chitinase